MNLKDEIILGKYILRPNEMKTDSKQEKINCNKMKKVH